MHPIRIRFCFVMLLGLLVPVGMARAQFTERTIPPSAPAPRPAEEAAPIPPVSGIPALAIPPRSAGAAQSRGRNAAVEPTAPAASSAPQHGGASVARPASAAATLRKYFPYTVASGDSLGRIASFFGVDLDTLARVNRLRPDDELFVGEKLKIPNPFEAERRNLNRELAALQADDRQTHDKLGKAEAELLSLKERNDSLTAEDAILRRDVEVLPWWRGAALGVGAAALLMLGVTVLTLFEWWMLRRRFAVVSDLAMALGHLDVKYKETLAKAELRMQQLYGRRRPGMAVDQSEHPAKTQEEIEIERLNRQLKAVLEDYLDRLGIRQRGTRRRGRLREMVGEAEESELGARGGVPRS
jgi:LysM repeat protein